MLRLWCSQKYEICMPLYVALYNSKLLRSCNFVRASPTFRSEFARSRQTTASMSSTVVGTYHIPYGTRYQVFIMEKGTVRRSHQQGRRKPASRAGAAKARRASLAPASKPVVIHARKTPTKRTTETAVYHVRLVVSCAITGRRYSLSRMAVVV